MRALNLMRGVRFWSSAAYHWLWIARTPSGPVPFVALVTDDHGDLVPISKQFNVSIGGSNVH